MYTSSIILIAWIHFTGRERFHCDLLSPSTTKEYLVLRVKFRIFIPCSNQIWISLTKILYRNPEYQISLKSARWRSHSYVRTDKHDEGNRRFPRLCKLAKIWFCTSQKTQYLTRLMLYRIMLARYCDDHMKHVSTTHVVNEKLLNDKFS